MRNVKAVYTHHLFPHKYKLFFLKFYCLLYFKFVSYIWLVFHDFLYDNLLKKSTTSFQFLDF